jgi:hypothetical protein
MALKSPEAAVRTALVSDSGVAAIVGTKVYPVLAPASADLPFITWRRISVGRQQSLSGPVGMPTVSLSVDLFAETYEATRELADAVRLCLDGWGGTTNNVRVANVSLTNEADGFVTLAGGDLPPVYTVQMTFSILWQEI